MDKIVETALRAVLKVGITDVASFSFNYYCYAINYLLNENLVIFQHLIALLRAS